MKLRALDPLLHQLDQDMLHTKSLFVEHSYELITQSVDPPFAISIDGLWGTGKTTVMKMLQNQLEKADFPIFWFNPWEYRQTQSIVLAFLQCLAAKHKDRIKEMQKSGGKILQVLLQSGLEAGLKIYTKGNLSLKGIKETFKEIEKGQHSFDNYQNSIETAKEEFKELIDCISKKHSDKPVIIFFDDLDRCLPDDAIKLLEALKNLFVTPECKAIFICGIDTRVAKQFISKHYSDIEEGFAINYFRKIFNLTVSMPYSPDIYELLIDYIGKLYGWDDPNGQKTRKLANMVYTRGLQTEMSSVRKYLSVINNFYAFQKYNPTYEFNTENDFIVHLLIVKEAWQPLYEIIVKEALKNRLENMDGLVSNLVSNLTEHHKERLLPEQGKFLRDYFIDPIYPFHKLILADFLFKYPTLA